VVKAERFVWATVVQFFSNEERTKMFSTVAAAKHDNRVLNKMKIVDEVRDLKSMGLSKSAISRYLDKNFNPIHASY
jgi:fibronectin type 3 domain-containing protein